MTSFMWYAYHSIFCRYHNHNMLLQQRVINHKVKLHKVVCSVLREQRIHPIVLYSSFTMEPSCRFKRLLSISGGYCPIILHRIKQRHIVRACFLSHVKRASAQGSLSHFALSPPLRTSATDRIKRAVSTCIASCCHNCGMTFYNDFNYRETSSMVVYTSGVIQDFHPKLRIKD